MHDLDTSLFHVINGWPDSLAPVMLFFSQAMTYWWFKVLVGALVLGLVAKAGKTRLAGIAAVVAVLLADTITNVLKHAWRVHRPFQDLGHEAILRIGKYTDDSMGTASAHSANMAAVAAVLTYCLGWRWGVAWILFAFVTGLSRIYVGVHYPSQVLLGWTCGVFAAFVVIKTWEAFARRRQAVSSNEPADNDQRPADSD